MAVGGALRAAIKAGRFGAAGRESRRQARALQSLNQNNSFDYQRMLPLEERGFERMSGMGYGATPRGNAVVVDPATGRRTVLPQNFDDFIEGQPARGRNPIEAPYEGVRVWGGRTNDGFPNSIGTPPPFIGRGTPPPTRSYRMYASDAGDEFPSAFRRSPYDEPFTMFEPLPFARPNSPNVQYGGQNLPYSSFFYGTGY
jgi:hypothetical protein